MRGFLIACLVLPLVAFADVTGRVVAVTDGDTIKVLDSTDTQHKIRLKGIDAPQRGQPFGTKSKDNLASMVAGKEVLVESDKNDHYGRVWARSGCSHQIAPRVARPMTQIMLRY